jgi:hypothetical protein
MGASVRTSWPGAVADADASRVRIDIFLALVFPATAAQIRFVIHAVPAGGYWLIVGVSHLDSPGFALIGLGLVLVPDTEPFWFAASTAVILAAIAWLLHAKALFAGASARAA